MKRKTVGILLAVVLLILAGAFFCMPEKETPPQQGNLLKNGDFAAVEDGRPTGWFPGMWVTSAGASYLEAVKLEDGTTAALVENAAPNDARFEQTVSVRENTTYRLSAKVMAEGCEKGKKGANLSFLGIYGTSADVHDTNGAWEDIELYARTGKGVKEATVLARVGGYGSENTGRAWFTDVALEEVDTVPVGAEVLILQTPEPEKKQEEKLPAANAKEQGRAASIAASCAYLLLAAWLILAVMRRGSPLAEHFPAGKVLGLLLLLAFLLRVLLSLFVEGYGVDMGCFAAWAGRINDVGLAHFYEEGYFCDYPPAYMLVLGLLGRIAGMLGISAGSMNMQVLMKLVPSACDILLALVLYRAAVKAFGVRPALVLAALLAFNPALVITGSLLIIARPPPKSKPFFKKI